MLEHNSSGMGGKQKGWSRALLRTLCEDATGNSNECPKEAGNIVASVSYNRIGNLFIAYL
jgi:hypothetical protein